MLAALEIARLLEPYWAGGSNGSDDLPEQIGLPQISEQLQLYLALILKWNERMNITAIREPEEIVRRHFGESLFAARHLGACRSLLDFGSGGGFPGVPIQLARPDVAVTLAESQGKKAAFLRETVRVLGLREAVWGGRVEDMEAGLRFDVVTMRAVDRMQEAMEVAAQRATSRLVLLGTVETAAWVGELAGFEASKQVRVPGAEKSMLLIATRVPCGTE